MKQDSHDEGHAKTVLTSVQKGVLTITLNRPEQLNALNPEMMREIVAVVTDARYDKKIGAVVITGAGRAFCSGGDMREDIEQLGKMSLREWREFHGNGNKIFLAIEEMEKPVIAAVNGVAVGGGCDLANVCDIRIASEDAKFGIFHVRMGFTPGSGATYHLPRLVGKGMAKLLCLTGDLIDAKEAERIGLVERVIQRDKFQTTVTELAEKLANGPRIAISQIKLAINKNESMNLRQTLEYFTESQFALWKTKDYKEAYTAFFEKRKPVFKGE